jgi:pyroglutamyl-peptidase
MSRSVSILVTGFEPFGGERINPSARVAEALHGRTIDAARVSAVVLPCAFDASVEALRSAIAQHRPRLVLALGQAAGRAGFSLERVAINLDDAPIADNVGAQPVDRPVVPRAAPARFTTLPIKAMVAALRAAGHPADVSHSAGSFVCNHVFYALQHALKARRGARSGFMHLPLLPEQTHARPGQPSLPLASMIDGVELALATAWRVRTDLRIGQGALD